MARIRGRGNKDTELALAKLLRAHGITGWRRQIQIRISERGMRNSLAPKARFQSEERTIRTLHSALRNFTVRPDFVFARQRLAIFVDGCFWHGCPKHATQPKNNASFWRKKLGDNKRRDALVTRTLRRTGWRVLRVWECQLTKHPLACLRRIARALR